MSTVLSVIMTVSMFTVANTDYSDVDGTKTEDFAECTDDFVSDSSGFREEYNGITIVMI